ncbi:PIR Superfamily Protein [Plasmodium ovale curtisi]|uniref:PIR Superfamily Protein n=1 Tax=Plasmodium ovale curtisi TaxID=864141 RepID=A0A1A8XCB8_PLAOA|nr:PIR Superfamily Protein [Plasmodium ovale curtisi]
MEDFDASGCYRRDGYSDAGYLSNQKRGDRLIDFGEYVCYKLKNFNGIKGQCSITTEKKFCDYLNYWLYDNVVSISTHYSQNNMFYNALNYIIQSSIPKLKCSFAEL